MRLVQQLPVQRPVHQLYAPSAPPLAPQRPAAAAGQSRWCGLARRLVPALALVSGLISAIDAADTGPVEPWSESFRMVLQDRERTFVTQGRSTYLVMEASDLKSPAFLHGKEVMFLGKFEHTDGQRAYLFGLDRFSAVGDLTLWSTRLEGDNLYLFGDVRVDGDTVELVVRDIVPARSDAEIVAKRLSEVAADNFAGRLAVSQWAEKQAATQGNSDWWQLAAAAIVADTATAAADAANTKQDAELLGQAFAWAIDTIKDHGLAARIASQPWFAEQAQAKAAAKRLTALGFDRYQDVWRPRTESLTLQFEDRFTAIPWRDAEAFYGLGRWVDRHAEDLPRARDLSFRAYQAGYRADANHPGIRRELGLTGEADRDGGRTAGGDTPTGPFQDEQTGIVVGGPEGWQRSRRLDDQARWVDLANDTSYLSLTILGQDRASGDFENTWEAAVLPWRVRSSFAEDGVEPVVAAVGQARRLRFHFQEGNDLRGGDLVLVQQADVGLGLVIVASYLEQDRDRAQAALLEMLAKISIPGGGSQAAPAENP